ncbi:TPA: hypothetical protein QCH65_000458 [Enterobacter roggenkampii]|nr:hypothetical protein [Enterobacter roggenkampii]
MKNFVPPISTSPIIRINAMEIVLRSILSSLTRDQRSQANDICVKSLNNLFNDPSLPSDNKQAMAEVADMVRFLFDHVPETH